MPLERASTSPRSRPDATDWRSLSITVIARRLVSRLDVVVAGGILFLLVPNREPWDELTQAVVRLAGDPTVPLVGSALVVGLVALGAAERGLAFRVADLTFWLRQPRATTTLLRQSISRTVARTAGGAAGLGALAAVILAVRADVPPVGAIAQLAATLAAAAITIRALLLARLSVTTLSVAIAMLATSAVLSAASGEVAPWRALVQGLVASAPAAGLLTALLLPLPVIGAAYLDARNISPSLLRLGSRARTLRSFAIRRSDVALFLEAQRELWAETEFTRGIPRAMWRRLPAVRLLTLIARDLGAVIGSDHRRQVRLLGLCTGAATLFFAGPIGAGAGGFLLWAAGLDVAAGYSQELASPRLRARLPEVNGLLRMLGPVLSLFVLTVPTAIAVCAVLGDLQMAIAVLGAALLSGSYSLWGLLLGAPRLDFATWVPPEYRSAAFFLRLAASPSAAIASGVGAFNALEFGALPLVVMCVIFAPTLLLLGVVSRNVEARH